MMHDRLFQTYLRRACEPHPDDPAAAHLRQPGNALILGAVLLIAAAPAIAGEVCDTTGAKTSKAQGSHAVACGYRNNARAAASSALGHDNDALGVGSTAVGYKNRARGKNSSAVGEANTASGTSSSAFGGGNVASGAGSSAFGSGNRALGTRSSAFGYHAAAAAQRSVALAGFYDRNGDGTLTLDIDADGDGVNDASSESAASLGTSAVAVGAGVVARGNGSAALGVNASADADYSTAIGFGAVADREYTLSVGAAGSERQIVNVAAGSQDTDAVNLAQLQPVAIALGGGAGMLGGLFTAPAYAIQDNTYGNVGAAFTAIDGELSAIKSRADLAVYYDDAGGGSITLQGSGNGGDGEQPSSGAGTRISNVADGVVAGDAVNKGQLDAGDAATLRSSNAYADRAATRTLASANAYTDSKFAAFDDQFRGIDERFRAQDRRIDRMGAIAGAYSGMAMNTSGLGGRNRLGVGVGAQGGVQAMAVGYQRALGDRASVSLGGAFGGGEKSVSAGAGFSW